MDLGAATAEMAKASARQVCTSTFKEMSASLFDALVVFRTRSANFSMTIADDRDMKNEFDIRLPRSGEKRMREKKKQWGRAYGHPTRNDSAVTWSRARARDGCKRIKHVFRGRD